MMATPARNLSEGEDHEDTDSQELFESFMEITKQQEDLQTEANGTSATENHQSEANGTSATENHQSEANGTSATVNFESEANGVAKSIIAVNADADKEHDVTCTDSNEQSRKDLSDTIQTPTEDEQNMTKRLSKAVDELSDLEKQLSLMISSGSCSTPIDLGDDKADGSAPQSGQDEKVAIWGDEGSDINKADTSENENDNHEKSVDTVPSCKEGEANSPNENNDDVFEATKDTDEKELEAAKNSSEIESTPSEVLSKIDTTDRESAVTAENIDNSVNNEKDDGAKAGKVENNNIIGDVETGVKDEDVAESHETADNTALETSVEESDKTLSSTLVDENQNSTEMEDGDTTIAVASTSNDVLPDEAVASQTEAKKIDTDPSTPEIEILMTDESGISERKSLDSLDVNLECEMRPDSPALSDDDCIDSDATSMDGLDDDKTPFDSGLGSDSKDRHLQVDRHRFGSNSSTISEREFRNSGIAKDDIDDLAKVHMKGYLMKLGGSGLTPRNWRKRWFVLKEDNCLYYYKNSKDKIPCGVIVLFNYSVTKAPDSNKKYCFKLNKGGARTYHFCAGNDDDMRQWMISLMQAASAVSATGASFQILEGNVHNVSIPALSIKDPECHGYLSKQGQGIKSWKRRYCVLKNGYLYYYSDMSNTTALGVARLLGYHIEGGASRGKLFCFYASPPDESMRVYHFAAETENDRERWMKRMEESIACGNMST